MNWKRLWSQWDGNVYGLAYRNCHLCLGTGRRERSVCRCVRREVFRRCLDTYWLCRMRAESAGRFVTRRHEGYEALAIDYLIDFEQVAHRVLGNSLDWRIFAAYIVGEWEPAYVRLRTGCTESQFHNALGRIADRVGAAFVELAPYGLYPPWRYFYDYDPPPKIIQIQRYRRAKLPRSRSTRLNPPLKCGLPEAA